MLLKPSSELHFVKTKEPMETVEIDLDSLEISSRHGYGDLVEKALGPLAKSNSSLCSTVWVYQGDSINFGINGYSAFFGVAGDKSLLKALATVFRATPGLKVRQSDSIFQSQAMCQYHLEGGELWREYEAYVWYAGQAEADPSIDDLESDHIIINGGVETSPLDTGTHAQFVDMEKTINKLPNQQQGTVLSVPSGIRTQSPLRIRRARADASLGSICRTIEEVFGLPEGAVALRAPDRKVLRRDATVGTLRRRWE